MSQASSRFITTLRCVREQGTGRLEGSAWFNVTEQWTQFLRTVSRLSQIFRSAQETA
jgi:hypothetical protein